MALLLAALTVGFYWRLVLTDQYTWLNGPDLARQVLPWYQFQAGEIQSGRLPLWDPYVYGGQPLIGQGQPGVAYPLNWLLFIMPTNQGWIRLTWLHWYFVVIHLIAVVFAYLLCRGVELSRTSSVFGAVLYGLGGFMGGNDWPQMLNGAVWIPLVLLFILKLAAGRRPWASAGAAGACLGIAMLSGHHQVPIYTALMTGFLLLWVVARSSGRRGLRAAQAAVLLVVAGLVSGLQSAPAWEYGQNAHRWAGAKEPVGAGQKVPYHVQETFSYTPQHLWGVLIPLTEGRVQLFAGVSGALLATAGMGGRRCLQHGRQYASAWTAV
jgi:hypothetical protein